MLKAFIRSMLFAAIISLLICLGGCSDNESADTAPSPTPTPEVGNEELIIPDSSGNLPEGIRFEDIIYLRPSTEELSEKLRSAAAMIEDDKLTIYDQISFLLDMNKDYSNFITMQLYARIMSSIDSSDEFYSAEAAFLDSEFSNIEALYKQVLQAAARSSHSSQLAGECFGFDALEPFINAAEPSDALTILKAEEAALIGEYRELISNSSESADRALEIFIELVEVRARIAGESGYDNYTDYIYATEHTDYSADRLDNIFDNISDYVVPVYNKLAIRVLNSNNRHPVDPHTKNRIMNHLGEVFADMDQDMSDVYSYLLYHGLFSVEKNAPHRFPMSMTAYLPSYRSPFLYVTMQDSLTDYMTVCHEFGHFYDIFVNGGISASVDLAETCSQTMELLAMLGLRDGLTTKEYKYLYCMEIESVLLNLIYQSLYSRFEHLVYSLPQNQINEASIEQVASAAISAMGFGSSLTARDLIVPHLILEPFYVQTYVTSSLVSLEIFFEEYATRGRGLAIYKSLIYRTTDLDLESFIDLVGLDSPFDEDTVREIADSIHYIVLGSHYFEEGGGEDSASAEPWRLPSLAA
ncbi:MAG: hypothetical protein IJE25_03555 [Clostridia bacterium]|nr:hypothetical protein [Clostridia bacterium]